MKIQEQNDTIVAIATASGYGAIAVIRLSGPNAISVVDSIFQGQKNLTEVPTHTVHYGKIMNARQSIIDDVLVTVFRGPHSYTGEDSVELSIHGNPLISQKIIGLLMEKDVRLAQAGEFTRRAFLNGKMDLTQAEAVAQVIAARSESALHGARNQLDGLLSSKVGALRSLLLDAASLLELELDFSEENIEFVNKIQLIQKIEDIESFIQELIASYAYGKIFRDGLNVAIVGKPNVGKSSLFNFLLKESRAIVSPIPGTTRDALQEFFTYEGLSIKLIDTAGLRFTEDSVEKEGVNRSEHWIKIADFILFINDVETGFSEDIYQQLLKISSKNRIIAILNKIDINKSGIRDARFDVKISVHRGEGIAQLLDKIKEKAVGDFQYTENSAVVCQERHFQQLKSAQEALLHAKQSLEQGLTGEFVAIDLRKATLTLEEIIGRVVPDDIVNNIFSSFCIGK